MSQPFFEVRINRNRLELYGDLRLSGLDDITHALHQVGVEARYPDIVMDFSSVSSVITSVAAPLAAYLRYLTQQYKVDYTYIYPRNVSVKSRISDIGLDHYIDYRKHEKPRFKSSQSVIMQFYNLEDCVAVTDKIINNVLRTMKIDRGQMAALEWAVTEITDNVLNHSKSPVGGFAIYQRIPRTNIVEFTVADCGIGIPRTLNIKD